MYALDCSDGNGEQIESRHVRLHMFLAAMRKQVRDLPEQERESFMRTAFFSELKVICDSG